MAGGLRPSTRAALTASRSGSRESRPARVRSPKRTAAGRYGTVASTSTRLEGREAEIFKAVFPHSIALAILVGLVVMLYAYVFPGLVPSH